MRTLASSLVVFVLSVGVVVTDEPVTGPSTQQQATPQEPAVAEQAAGTRVATAHSGPEPAPAVAPFDAEQAKQHQEAWAKHLGVPVELTNSIGMKLVLIPPGEFMMGSRESLRELGRIYGPSWLDSGWYADQLPQHSVRITKPYRLGMHEVTVGQFRQFVKATNYQTDPEKPKPAEAGAGFDPFESEFQYNDEDKWQTPGFPQSDDHPVVNVSWDDAVAFCAWLTDREEKRYGLPTEAQWEYACRAGTTTQYNLGDDPKQLTELGLVQDLAASSNAGDQAAVSQKDGHVNTLPVGRFPPNNWGLHDMHGNVCEWCADSYEADYYKNSPRDDPAGPDIGIERVMRGGCFGMPPQFCRSAFRWSGRARSRGGGFRVALDQVEKAKPAKEGK